MKSLSWSTLKFGDMYGMLYNRALTESLVGSMLPSLEMLFVNAKMILFLRLSVKSSG